MLKCVPEPYDKEFDEIVDYLVETYAPYLRAIPAAEEQTDSEEGEQGGEGAGGAEAAVSSVEEEHAGQGAPAPGKEASVEAGQIEGSDDD